MPMLMLTIALASALALSAQSQNPLRAHGVSDADATDALLGALASGPSGPFPGAAVFKSAPPAERAALVRAAFAFARSVTGSAEFAQRYAVLRASRRPTPPAVPRTGDEARAEQQRQMVVAIQQAQDRAGQMPADLRKQLDAEIEAMKRQIEDLNAEPEYRAAVDAAAREAAAQADAAHAAQLREFDERLPASARTLIARRLQRFLEACANVDYSAELRQGADRKWRFADAALERQSSEWKLCYRAGRPAVDAARRAAQQWLKELVH
jgi:hypothetical protein